MNLDIQKYRFPEPVYVTRPSMPPLREYNKLLEEIWESRFLANSGKFHHAFEEKLAGFLGVEHLSLFSNGTIALLLALQELGIDGGEVITTPFTFPATTHALNWNNIEPVFCDIDPETLNLDPARIEESITPKTRAILPVHVFGRPCDVDAIDAMAQRHGLHVIYDAAHAFGVRVGGRPIVEFGDVSMLSFHATKHFTTAEGGALIVRTDDHRQRLNQLKNFGIIDEETVLGPGINGKMSELQAAFGLLALDSVEGEIAARARVVEWYRAKLEDVPGIMCVKQIANTTPNHTYFPLLIDEAHYGLSRDAVYIALRDINVHARKYFYPLCSDIECYASLPSSNPERLPVARRVASQVLCLPLYADLPEETVNTICTVLHELPG